MNNNLDRIIFEKENSLIIVSVEQDHPPIKIGDSFLGPFKKGTEFKLLYWQARLLLRANIIKFKENASLTRGDLVKILWTELQNPQIKTITLDKFYLRIKGLMKDLDIKYRQSQDPRINEEITRTKKLFEDILSQRSYKIMKLALKAEKKPEVLFNLTDEEKWLYDSLLKLFNQYRLKIL